MVAGGMKGISAQGIHDNDQQIEAWGQKRSMGFIQSPRPGPRMGAVILRWTLPDINPFTKSQHVGKLSGKCCIHPGEFVELEYDD